MKIFRVDLQKAKNNIKNKTEGYPRVEQGNISPFLSCKQFWNIPTPLWFSKDPLRELHCQNIFTWTTLCLQENYNWNLSGLQRTQKKTRPRKNSLCLNQSVFWPAYGQKSRWNMTANQNTANHTPQVLFLDQSEKKTESGFWTYDPTSKCIMPSFPTSKYREGGRDRRLVVVSHKLYRSFLKLMKD